MNVYYHQLELNTGISTDYQIPRLIDEIDVTSPPAAPLQFPRPTFFSSCQRNILARDHVTGETHLIKALMRKQQTNSGFACSDHAYFLRSVQSRSADKREKTWTAAVLRSVKDDRPMSCIREESEFGVRWETTGELVSVRVSIWKKLSAQYKRDLVQEVSALQYIGSASPHLQGCRDLLKDEHRVYTVMPHTPQHGLSTSGLLESPAVTSTVTKNSNGVIQPPDEDRARHLFKQLCTGLLHLQNKGLYHGNICPKSLILVEGEKLAINDLGRSVRVPFNDPFNVGYVTDASESEQRRLIHKAPCRGSMKYQAHEVGSNGFDAFASDVFSAGVVLFELLTGLAPFRRPKHSDPVFNAVSHGQMPLLLESWGIALSEEACDLLQNMLWQKPSDRMNVNEILEHPWLSGQTTPMSSHRPELHNQEMGAQSENSHNQDSQEFRMRHSLQQELLLRTGRSSNHVHFGLAETIVVYDSSDSASDFLAQSSLQTDRITSPTFPFPAEQQDGYQESSSTTASGDSTKADAPTPGGLWRLKKFVKSAKRTLKRSVLHEKSTGRVEVDGPVTYNARSA